MNISTMTDNSSPGLKTMYAEKLMLETDTHGYLKQLPRLPPNVQLEAIFLVLTEYSQPSSSIPRRKPSPKIAGQGRILGDIVAPVTAPADWEVLT